MIPLDLNIEFVHAIAQDTSSGSKKFGGSRLHTVTFLERFNDELPLKVSTHLIEFDG